MVDSQQMGSLSFYSTVTFKKAGLFVKTTSVRSVFLVCNNTLSEIKGPGGGGGYSEKFYTGRLRPEVLPLTLLYTIFSEKVPLSYTFYWKKAPLSYTFLRRLMNKSLKQKVF